MFRHLNLNPRHKNVGDCAVRAISLLMDEPWDKIYTEVFETPANDIPVATEVKPEYVTKDDFNAFADKMINMLSEQRKPRFEKKGGQRNAESDL